MDKKRFSDVFYNVQLSANVKSHMRNVFVREIQFNKTTRIMYIHLSSSDIIDESCLNFLKEDLIADMKFLSDVKIKIDYLMEGMTNEQKFIAYWNSLLTCVKNETMFCYYALEKAEKQIEDDTIKFVLQDNVASFLYSMNIDKLLRDKLSERIGVNYSISFVDKKTPDDFGQKELEIQRIFENINTTVLVDESEKTEKPKIDNSNAISSARPVVAKPMLQHENKGFAKRTKSGVEICEELLDNITKINDIVNENEIYTVECEILDIEIVETRKGSYILKMPVTDKSNSIFVKIFCSPDEYLENLSSVLKKGSYVKIQGKSQRDRFEHDEMVLIANKIAKGEAPPIRMDESEEKRVELHLHTQMSMMDAVTSATAYIERAAKWGHKAIAITDHGVVQAYPEAMNAGKKNGVKILYGCEAYMVDDLGAVVKNGGEKGFDETFVVFDLETTGLKKETDVIIEIGAVKVKNGEITDTFMTFINPERQLDEKIVKLTGITDDMLVDAPLAKDIMPKFLDFVKDTVLVAHNANFDVGFVRQWMNNNGYSIDFTVLDTVELAKTLFTDLHNYKLDTVCKHLEVSLENHHRAVDDATATAHIFIKCMDILNQMQIEKLEELNAMASQNINKREIKKYYHTIILVQNMKGLRNLYELVSDAHIKYYLRRPKIPKSELIKKREGLIIGSACEAGELFTAVYDGQPQEVIKELVDFYDYLEIQPIGNNEFMINNQSKNGKSVADKERLVELNNEIIALGEKYNKPVVVTSDAHFLDPEDEVYRRIVQTGEGFKDVDKQAPLYFRTTEEMLEEFSYLGKEKAYEIVVKNTNLIADMLDDIRPVPSGTYPPHMDNAEEDLTRITTNKAKEIYGDPLPEIVAKRLDRELTSIIKNGFAVLYIIAQKLVWNSVENGYIVGSRGSVGSSFVATMAGITEVNPLDPHYICAKCKYSDFDSEVVKANAGNSGFDLPDKICPVCGEPLQKNGQAIPFETFLGFDGDKEPDIDLNFSGEYQQRAHRYCEQLFGDGHVFKAGTIGTLQEKTVYGYIKKYCEERGVYINSAEMKRIALGCVGVKRTTGQHPGGLIVVPQDNSIYNFTPVQHPANDFNSIVTTTHFDYHSIHDNLLKLDMLGHDVPTILRMFYDITGFDPLNVPMDDKATLSLFTKPDALGVTEEEINCNTGSLGLPEFGTNFVRQMLIETQPNSFSDLVRISGLSHGTDVWTGNAQELVKNNIATIKEIIPTRDDIMVYLIIKGVENKSAFDIMEKVRKGKGLSAEHEATMREHNVPDWYIDSCKKIKYMFPKGHAVAYVTNTFRIGYFKINFPYAFYAATFSVKVDDFDYSVMCFGDDRVLDKMKEIKEKGNDATAKDKTMQTTLELVHELYARKLNFVKIDLYESDAVKFRVVEDGLLPPLCTIQGLGANAAQSIVDARQDGKFETVDQLRERTTLGKTVLQLLRDSGILDGISETNQLTLF